MEATQLEQISYNLQQSKLQIRQMDESVQQVGMYTLLLLLLLLLLLAALLLVYGGTLLVYGGTAAACCCRCCWCMENANCAEQADGRERAPGGGTS